MTGKHVHGLGHEHDHAALSELGAADLGIAHRVGDGSDAPGAPLRSTWFGRLWDTWDLPPAERRLLFKVDAVILTFASLGYFLKNLDQTNIDNAYLSGMEEDLSMYGNQLVTAKSIWTVGYVVGQIPVGLLITRASPRWVIPSLEVVWGLMTLSSYAVKDYRALYALRFLVGLAESGFYPAMHYLLGGWYTPREIGKRAMIFWTAGSVGTIFSGFLQAAAYTNLSGVNGLAGWRWLFIIDAIITLPIALFGFAFLPGLPLQGTKAWWLSHDEHDLACERMRRLGRAGKTPWSWPKVRRLASSWHTYLFPLCYIVWNNGGVSTNPMGYYLKSFNASPAPVPGRSYTVAQIDNYPLVTTTVLIVSALFMAWQSDGVFRGRRWPFIYIGAVLTFSFDAALRFISLYGNIPAHFALYWLLNVGNFAGPLIFSWVNEVCGDDTEKRALIITLGNDLAYVVGAVAPNFVWKTTDYPLAHKGYTYSMCLQGILFVVTTVILVLLRRDQRKALSSLLEAEGLATDTPDTPLSGSEADEKEGKHVDKV
ncbi:hypothetical protein Q5752_006110 [Cryptotrichosporon argae]